MEKHRIYSAIKRLLIEFGIFIENDKEFDKFMFRLADILNI